MLDFGITRTHFFATSTDYKLRVWNFRTDKFIGEFVIEGLATSMAILEYSSQSKQNPNKSKYELQEDIFDDEIESRVSNDYTFIAIGFLNGFTVYEFDYRLGTLTHVGARNLPNPTGGRLC